MSWKGGDCEFRVVVAGWREVGKEEDPSPLFPDGFIVGFVGNCVSSGVELSGVWSGVRLSDEERFVALKGRCRSFGEIAKPDLDFGGRVVRFGEFPVNVEDELGNCSRGSEWVVVRCSG